MLRSVQSRMREKVSAPTTMTVRACPERMKLSATERPKTKPLQTACTSNAAPRLRPRFAWMRVAVAGKVSSGVEVAQTIMSSSSAAISARASACSAAFDPRSEVNSPSSASRRSRMPVRCLIHSSEVSTRRARSPLLMTRDGR